MKIENVFSKPVASLSVFLIAFVLCKMIDFSGNNGSIPIHNLTHLHVFRNIY